jgi:hypothetical protein
MAWSPSPDRSDVVEQTNRDYPWLLQYNTKPALGEFLQRVVALNRQLHPEDSMGLLTKSSGENHVQFPNGVMCAVDVVTFPSGNRVDIVQGSDAHPTPAGPSWNDIPEYDEAGNPLWRENNVYVNIDTWPIWDSGTPHDVVEARSELGRGWFCMLRALHEFPEFQTNWDFLMANEDPTFFRVLFDVEGMKHSGATGIDPWRDAGCSYKDPWWPDTVRQLLDKVGSLGKGIQVTMYGGRELFPNTDEMARYHDAFVQACNGRWQAVKAVEVANEFNVNGWGADEVQWCAQDLRSKLPGGMPLALSGTWDTHGDTNEDMLTGMESLYGRTGSDHYGANYMTVHIWRDRNSKWSDPFSYNNLMPELPKANGEPPGQGASAGGDVNDPNVIVDDYRKSSEARWVYYVGHNSWCVWNGHMPAEWIDYFYVHNGEAYAQMHAEKYIQNMPNQLAVSQGLNEYHDSGTVAVPPSPGPTPPTPGADNNLNAGERLGPGMRLIDPTGRFVMEYGVDGNLVIYDGGPPNWIWQSRSSHEQDYPDRNYRAGYVEMQADGNFVIYAYLDDVLQPIRATHTDGSHPGCGGHIQVDGNFVMYDTGSPYWASMSSDLYDEKNEIVSTRHA